MLPETTSCGNLLNEYNANTSQTTVKKMRLTGVELVSTFADFPLDLWNKLVNNPQALAATSPLDLQRALLSGIPSPLRGTIWQILSASKNPDLEQVYTNVLLATSSPQEKLIRKDISRTFPKQDYFRTREGPNGQESLFNVCKAYSLYDPEVNYVQGMAFIVGPLLLNVICL